MPGPGFPVLVATTSHEHSPSLIILHNHCSRATQNQPLPLINANVCYLSPVFVTNLFTPSSTLRQKLKSLCSEPPMNNQPIDSTLSWTLDSCFVFLSDKTCWFIQRKKLRLKIVTKYAYRLKQIHLLCKPVIHLQESAPCFSI